MSHSSDLSDVEHRQTSESTQTEFGQTCRSETQHYALMAQWATARNWADRQRLCPHISRTQEQRQKRLSIFCRVFVSTVVMHPGVHDDSPGRNSSTNEPNAHWNRSRNEDAATILEPHDLQSLERCQSSIRTSDVTAEPRIATSAPIQSYQQANFGSDILFTYNSNVVRRGSSTYNDFSSFVVVGSQWNAPTETAIFVDTLCRSLHHYWGDTMTYVDIINN